MLIPRWTLVVEDDACSLAKRELPRVGSDLPGEHAQQGRLSRSVGTGKRNAVAPLDLERDSVEQRIAGKLLAETRGDEDGHR